MAVLVVSDVSQTQLKIIEVEAAQIEIDSFN